MYDSTPLLLDHITYIPLPLHYQTVVSCEYWCPSVVHPHLYMILSNPMNSKTKQNDNNQKIWNELSSPPPPPIILLMNKKHKASQTFS